MPKYHSDRAVRAISTDFLADIAWGDPLYGSAVDLDAAIDRDARRARWQRRKAR